MRQPVTSSLTISGGSSSVRVYFHCTLKMKHFPRQTGGAQQSGHDLGDGYGRRGGVGDGLVASEEELTGGIGGARPAVCEPRPSFCKVFASSLPEGFRPCTS
jgi:hypothetical protein